MKCNETIGKWCKNKHGASKIIDTFETYQPLGDTDGQRNKMLTQKISVTPALERRVAEAATMTQIQRIWYQQFM
jgi:hypothetical protein